MPLLVEIKVVPSSGKLECKLEKNNTIKCFLKSPPEKGKANTELVKFLSKQLKVPQQDIAIVTGESTRKKLIKINQTITLEEFCTKLGLEYHASLPLEGYRP